MTVEWISLAEALDYESRVLLSRENAKVQLREALQTGKLAARAEELVEIDTSFFVGHSFVENAWPEPAREGDHKEVPPRAWEFAEIGWDQSRFKRRSTELPPSGGDPGRDLPAYVGRDVQVPRSQIDEFWPQEEPASTLPRARLKKPGRPKGTGLADLDRPLVEEMHRSMSQGLASSKTAAARSVEQRAKGSIANRVKRLVERYRRTYEEK